MRQFIGDHTDALEVTHSWNADVYQWTMLVGDPNACKHNTQILCYKSLNI